MKLDRSSSDCNAVALYELTDAGTQVPVFKYWPIPVGVLSSRLRSTTKLLLGLMYRHAGRGGRLSGWGVRRLAAELRVSESAVRRHRRALVETGLITVTPGPHREAPDVYQLQLFHPWMRMPVVHVPSGLVTHLSHAALLVYGWVAWKQGNGHPWRWARSQVAQAVGIGEEMAKKVRSELEHEGFIACSRLPGRANRWDILNHASLSTLLIEGRGVLAVAPQALSDAGGVPGDAPRALSDAQLTPTATPTSDSSKESIPIYGGYQTTHRRPSGGYSSGGGRRKISGEFDAEAAEIRLRTKGKFGW